MEILAKFTSFRRSHSSQIKIIDQLLIFIASNRVQIEIQQMSIRFELWSWSQYRFLQHSRHLLISRSISNTSPLFLSKIEHSTNHQDSIEIYRFSWKTWLVGCAWDTHTYSWLSTPTWVWNRSRFRRGAIRSISRTKATIAN